MKYLFDIITLGIVGVFTRPVWTNIHWGTEWLFISIQKEAREAVSLRSVKAKSPVHCSVICSSLSLQVDSLFFVPSTGFCHCHKERDNCITNTTSETILYGLRKINGVNTDHLTVVPCLDCLEFYNNGCTVDGVYPIIGWDSKPALVHCDMKNGGWTHIQQRFNGSMDFYRDWMEYRLGFGDVNGEYWFGLENIHNLTAPTSELIVYAEMFPGITPPSMTAHYGVFNIASNSSEFRLSVAEFDGTCGDSLAIANGYRFSTFDDDNDGVSHKHCAALYHGGWWYMNCHRSSMNGDYYQPEDYDSVLTQAK